MPPLRVLLADDEPTYVEFMAKVLGRRGMAVRTAASGAAAVAAVAAEPFDAVILDLRMPGTDGLAALRELRRLRPDLPVVLLSGHADLAAATEALRAGAADFLLKPCPAERLVCAIEDACERRAAAAALGNGK